MLQLDVDDTNIHFFNFAISKQHMDIQNMKIRDMCDFRNSILPILSDTLWLPMQNGLKTKSLQSLIQDKYQR